MHRRIAASWRQGALVTLAIWTLFGCARCRRGEEPITDIGPAPVPTVTEPATSTGTPISERPRAGETTIIEEMNIVYFDYDRFDLDAEDRARLDQNAEWLRQNPDVDVLIEGHCDERGTDEYNYALGERRANAVLEYLRGLNVPNQLYTRSYGETRPAREGHDESAWRWNRRVQFSRYAD